MNSSGESAAREQRLDALANKYHGHAKDCLIHRGYNVCNCGRIDAYRPGELALAAKGETDSVAAQGEQHD